MLHPSTGGFVSLAVADEEGLYPTRAVRSDHLQEHPPQTARDSYVSINQAFCIKQRNGSKDAICGEPFHRTDTLRYLCAAYADLDFYKLGLTVEDVLARLQELREQGKIPAPSLLVHSGQGLWAVWLLRDENDLEQPVHIRERGSELKLHAAIQNALHRQLVELGADKNASSAVRYLRMPGSLNTKSEVIVRWDLQVDENCRIPIYTLPELSNLLGISLSESAQATSESTPARPNAVELGSAPKRGRAGWEALRARRMKDFHTLRLIRGGFGEGVRNKSVFYYAWLLAQFGMSKERAQGDAEILNSSCKPPLRQNEVRAAVKSAYSRRCKKFCDQTIAEWLDITPEEANRLCCQKTAARFHRDEDAMPVPKPKRVDRDTARINGRRTAILQIIAETNSVAPNCRRMAELLTARGFPVGHVTVAKDYRELGICTSQPAYP